MAKELDEFEILRRKQKQRTTAESQVAGEGIRRRFAALGALSSGAAIKQEQLAKEAVARRGQEALSTIDVAQRAEARRREELGEQRAFQAEQAQLGREFGREERIGTQEFQGGEAEKQRVTAQQLAASDRSSREFLQKAQISSTEKLAKWNAEAAEKNIKLSEGVQSRLASAAQDYALVLKDLDVKSAADIQADLNLLTERLANDKNDLSKTLAGDELEFAKTKLDNDVLETKILGITTLMADKNIGSDTAASLLDSIMASARGETLPQVSGPTGIITDPTQAAALDTGFSLG